MGVLLFIIGYIVLIHLLFARPGKGGDGNPGGDDRVV